MVTPKNSQNTKVGAPEKHIEDTNPKNDRHPLISEEPKRPKKTPNLRSETEGMEFQCTEELIYKKPAILDKNKQLTPKNNIEGKNVPKELTLTRKK